MSGIELPQLMDDNLITRRKKILQSIEDIRSKKQEIAKALRELGVGNPQQNEDVKNDMQQLLAAYDAISKQEAQYMDILKTIVGIHEQATLDIAKDFERKIEEDTQKMKEEKEKQARKAENPEEPAEDSEEVAPGDPASNEVMAEIQEALLELKKVSEAAVAASELNEKLVERLQLQKKKKSVMMENREKRAKDLDEEAARVRAEVMLKINKMAALKKSTGKQEKELKELQKKCLELGIQMSVDENPALDPSAEQDTLDDNQRVPRIEETQEKAELNEEEKEKRRNEIRENIKKEMEKKEQVNTLIREKLASMDARRKRLQEIRKMLEKQEKKEAESKVPEANLQTGEGIKLTPETPRQSFDESEVPIAAPEDVEDDGPVLEKSLDDILENARANLSNLTAMRERLEHIKETEGADLNEDDIQLLQQLENVDLDEVEKKPLQLIMSSYNDVAPSEAQENDQDQAIDTQSDIESVIRATFHSIFTPKPLVLVDEQREMIRKARKAAVEEMIGKIDEKVRIRSE